jgi:hypothetical protein
MVIQLNDYKESKQANKERKQVNKNEKTMTTATFFPFEDEDKGKFGAKWKKEKRLRMKGWGLHQVQVYHCHCWVLRGGRPTGMGAPVSSHNRMAGFIDLKRGPVSKTSCSLALSRWRQRCAKTRNDDGCEGITSCVYLCVICMLFVLRCVGCMK